MENKLAKRSSFARRLISSQIVSTQKQFTGVNVAEFLSLVNQFRDASCLLDYSTHSGHAWFYSAEYILRGIKHLCNSKRYWVRDPWDWKPAQNDVTFNALFGSLARHLVATHEVPRFLDQAWWSQDCSSQQYRMWFRHLGQGNSLMGLRVPRLSSRAVVKRFLQAPDHLTVDGAISWAQKPSRNEVENQIYPAGISRRRQRKQRGYRSEKLWKRIGVNDFFHTQDLASIIYQWQIRQIRSAEKLQREGDVMRHCVGSYEDACRTGKTTVWSMTRRVYDGGMSSTKYGGRVLTIEVAPNRVIRTALGPLNRRPKADEREVFLRWAAKEKLKLDRWV